MSRQILRLRGIIAVAIADLRVMLDDIGAGGAPDRIRATPSRPRRPQATHKDGIWRLFLALCGPGWAGLGIRICPVLAAG